MNKRDVIEFFDNLADGWDDDLIRNEEAIKIILDKGEISEGKHILDVACGTGVLFPDYISRGAVITGIDISGEMVKQAKAKYPSAKIICADAETYNFTEQFDGVMIYNAFPHFPHAQQLFENLAKALKDSGRLTVAHGMSEEQLQQCHSSRAQSVSLPLPSKEKLAEIMSELFEVDVMISDEKMYMVSGVKK